MDVNFIIPVFNQLSFTARCLASLNETGIPDSTIIVVDNGSTDGTREFLQARAGLKVVTNETNRGCACGWNQGVIAAEAAWLVIMNNDVVVAPGFLEGLVAFAEETGHHIVSPAMCEGDLDYDLAAFADSYLRAMRLAMRRGCASGVCFMVHRRVFARIGLFDKKLGLAGYEDEDFFRRARRAGFQLAVTGRAFLHHFGSVTQKTVKAQRGAAGERLGNRDYFRQKHRLTWFKRKAARVGEKIQEAFWRWNELRRFGYTLRLERTGGVWYYH